VQGFRVKTQSRFAGGRSMDGRNARWRSFHDGLGTGQIGLETTLKIGPMNGLEAPETYFR
jgi:hypothetical protein